jgi:pilus assembly protein FimV
VRRAADAQARLSALQEQATSREKAIQEANTRVAALEKNIQEMQRLLELKNQALLQLQKQASVPPKGEVPTGQAAPPAMPPKIAPETKAPAPTVPVMPPTPTAPWYQGLLGNPAYVGGGAAALILAGLAWLVVQASRRRRGLTSFEDSIMTGGELRGNVQEKSAGGGAVVDTGDSSFLTDFSQAGLGNIDTHDVDPIAEAEVYMAYGRDAQAEEILKEAMARDPSRHEIHLKLLEIYAGRKNFTAFETIATELYAALGGEPSPIWQKAAELGRRIDPKNPLYTVSVGAPAVEAQVEAGSDAPVSPPAEAHPETPSPEEHASTSPPEGAGTPTPMDSEQLAEFADSGMEFDLAGFSATGPEGSGEAAPSGVSGSESETATAHFPDLDFRLETPPSHPAEEVKAEMPPPLDLSGIDLDLGEPEKVAAPAEAAPTQTAAESPEHGATEIRPAAIDPELWQEVATKLDLARAYIEMGDAEGAKEILQEVVGEGDARQREEANKMLASIA